MKKEILRWFKHHRDFASGIVIYRKYGINKAYARMFNMSGATKENMNILIEEFRQMAGLSFAELKELLDKPVKKQNLQKNDKAESDKEESDKAVRTKSVQKVAVKDIPQKKLRDEFPFLSDPNCPVELKAMIADKISAYHNYKKGHEDLFNAESTEEQLTAVRKVVENYISNQEMYKELDHFKKMNEILGEHDFFKKLYRLKELSALTTEDLVKLKDNLRKYILRDEKKSKDKTKEDSRGKILQRIAWRKWELVSVENLLTTRK